MLQLSGHQRQHVLPPPEEHLPRGIVDAGLGSVKALEAILLRLLAAFLMGFEKADPAEQEHGPDETGVFAVLTGDGSVPGKANGSTQHYD